MPVPTEVVTERPFDDQEMDRRILAVRQGMQAADVDLLLLTDPHDIYYLTAGRELGGLMQLALVVPDSGELGFAARAVDVVAFVAHICRGASEDRGCRLRTRMLYLPLGEHRFACRECHDLTYVSRRASHRYDHLIDDLVRLLPMHGQERMKALLR